MTMVMASAFDDDTARVICLMSLLMKLRIAGLQRRSITPSMAITASMPSIPKYAIRFAVVSLSIDYLVGVRFTNHDHTILHIN